MPRKKVNGNENLEQQNTFQNEIQQYKKMLQEQFPQQLKVQTRDNVLNTGFVLFDEIVGGIPIGQITMISSLQGVGKTTLMIQLAQKLQKNDQVVIYIDTEQSMSFRRMRELGLDTSEDKLIYIQPDTLEDAYKIIQMLLQQKYENEVMKDKEVKTPFVFQFDSITQAPSQEEIQEGIIHKSPAIKQRINSKQLPKLQKLLSITNSSLLIVNQLRKNINMSGFYQSQETEDITGGLQLKFFQTVDLRLDQGSTKQVENKFGLNGKIVYMRQNKNRLMSPMIEFPMVLDYHHGFLNQYSLFVFLQELTEEEWKRQGFNSQLLYPSGSYYRLVFDKLNYEKTFRLKNQFELYVTDEMFRRQINSLQITVIRRLYKGFDKSYYFVEDENNPVIVYEDFINYTPLAESSDEESIEQIQMTQE